MEDNQRYRLKKLGFAFTLLVLAISAFLIINSFRFHVVGTNPSANAVTIDSPFFDLNFNKDLSTSGVSVGMNHSGLRSYSVDGKALKLILNAPLSAGVEYTVTINSISSIGGITLKNLHYSFSPTQVDFNQLPADQQKTLINEQDKNQATTDPLLTHLPYSTLDYSLTGVISNQNGKSALVVQAVLVLNQSQMSNESAAIDQEKQEVSNYIESFNLNPVNYTIEYTVSAPGN